MFEPSFYDNLKLHLFLLALASEMITSSEIMLLLQFFLLPLSHHSLSFL